MCGIVGIIAESERLVRQALAPMNGVQTHRGPDDSGEAISTFGPHWLGLGQRRLSIIDLSPAGHQPMVDLATGCVINFNGEIYNFAELRKELDAVGQSFRGYSDTEVMLYGLARWGPEYVKRLAGMFAFAFFDPRSGGSLMLARDSLGIKPLYVARAPQRGLPLMFASEVRGILASGAVEPRIDEQGLAGLLAYGAVQQPRTIIRGVESFPPGCYRIVRIGTDGRTLREEPPVRYWDFPAVRQDITEAQAVEQLRATLDESVKEHLVADRSVGVFLSSGLDSTIIAGLGARHTPQLRSFTVGFADQPDLSEVGLARETARLFGLRHTEIIVNAADAEAAATAWLDSLDQPSVDGLNVYLISKVIREHGIVVALSGQGGDELFGGYPSFQQVPQIRRVLRGVRWLPRGLRVAAAQLAGAGTRRSLAVRQKLIDIARSGGDVLELCLQRRRVMSDGQLAALGIDADALSLSRSFLPREAQDDFRVNGDMIRAISAAESRFYQGNMLLRDSDTNGMCHSLEIRVPILDLRMLNLAYSLPGRIVLPQGKADKHLLRVAFADLLRPELLQQKKRGFVLPIRRWMLGPLREVAEESLRTLKETGLVKSEGVDAIWRDFLAEPESPIWSRAFTLVVLGHYLRKLGGGTKNVVAQATAPRARAGVGAGTGASDTGDSSAAPSTARS